MHLRDEDRTQQKKVRHRTTSDWSASQEAATFIPMRANTKIRRAVPFRASNSRQSVQLMCFLVVFFAQVHTTLEFNQLSPLKKVLISINSLFLRKWVLFVFVRHLRSITPLQLNTAAYEGNIVKCG